MELEAWLLAQTLLKEINEGIDIVRIRFNIIFKSKAINLFLSFTPKGPAGEAERKANEVYLLAIKTLTGMGNFQLNCTKRTEINSVKKDVFEFCSRFIVYVIFDT